MLFHALTLPGPDGDVENAGGCRRTLENYVWSLLFLIYKEIFGKTWGKNMASYFVTVCSSRSECTCF